MPLQLFVQIESWIDRQEQCNKPIAISSGGGHKNVQQMKSVTHGMTPFITKSSQYLMGYKNKPL